MSRRKKQVGGVPKNLSFSEECPDENTNVKDRKISLEGILKKKLKVFRVSPIYNFDNKRLRLYGNKLSEEINSKKKLTSEVTYKCSFTLDAKMRLSDESPEALRVEVTTNQSRSVYVGYFISWENTKENIEGFVSLPILLVEAKGLEISYVHSSFCKIFDCDIQPVTFSLFALVAFFVKMLETPRESNDKESLTLEYRVPGCGVKDNLKINLSVVDTTVVLAIIMDSLREGDSEITDKQIVWEFYSRILNHVYKVFQMDLMLAELHKIISPNGSITVNGELHVSTNDAAAGALSVLQCFTPLNTITNI